MPKTLKLSPQSRWLLLYLKERHEAGLAEPQIRKPLGVSAIAPLPVATDLPGGRVGMVHMRGLIRRGWAEEKYNGIYYLTDAGLAEANKLVPSNNIVNVIKKLRALQDSRWLNHREWPSGLHTDDCPGCSVSHYINEIIELLENP